MNLAILYALVGALIVLGERNDTRELGFMRTAQWTFLEAALLTAGLWQWPPDVELWRQVSGMVIFMLTLTAGHSMILCEPGDPLPSEPNWLEAQVIAHGGSLKVMWWTHALLRYTAPMVLSGGLLNSPAMAVAGFVIVLGYWPVAYWLNPLIKGDGETTKFTGAFICGLAMYGGLAISLFP